MTKISVVENKSRKQTVKVKTAPTSGRDANPKPLLSRIDDLEKQVSELRRTNLKFVWGLWVVFVIFVIVFGIVIN